MIDQTGIGEFAGRDASPAHDRTRLLGEQIRLIYVHAPMSMIAAGINSVILTIVLWKVVPSRTLLIWLLLNLFVLWLHFLLVKAYKRSSVEQVKRSSRNWEFLFIVGLVSSGILMGSAAVFLFPEASFVHQVFIAFVLGGMVAGAAGTYSAMLGAFFAYGIPVVVPMIVRLFHQGGDMQIAMGCLLLLFSIIMFSTAYSVHKATIRSLELRFENTSLISTLTTAKGRAEEMVEALRREIADREKAQKAMRESELQFRMLVETMNEGLGVQDENGVITYVNDKLCEMLGYSREEIVGRPAIDLVDENGRVVCEEEGSRQRMLKRTSSEVQLMTKNQRKIPTIVSASPIFEEKGGFRGVITAITDVTILKRAEKKLRESEEKYRMIFEKSPLGIFHFDKDGVLTACNDNFVKMMGCPKEELIGLSLVESVADEEVKTAIAACLSGKPAHYEGYCHALAGGKVTPMKAEYGPILTEEGVLLGGIGIIEDISERKRVEKELQEQLHFLQTLMDTIPNPVFYKDRQGRYMGCNKAFEARLGLSKEDIVGKTVYDLLPKDLADQYHRMDLELLGHPDKELYDETSLIYADGKRHDVIINKGAFTDVDGKLAGIVGVTVDITERKEAENEVRRARDDLEVRVAERTGALARANEELRMEIAERKRAEDALRNSSEKLKLFAYSVVHDLKSPAIAIHGLTRLFCKHYGDSLDEKGKNYCEQITKASEYLATLVEKINLYMSAKEAPLTVEQVNLKEILQMVKDEFSAQLSVRQVEWYEPETMPEIVADRLSILRVFRNLVDNALKYGGEQMSEIRIGYDESEAFYILSVSDNGVGIAREDSKKIFELFQRHQTSRGVEGAGLGLAIVKEIAERHHGEVWVEPGLERGATFYVSLSKQR